MAMLRQSRNTDEVAKPLNREQTGVLSGKANAKRGYKCQLILGHYHNFFIKQIPSLHKLLYEVIRDQCLKGLKSDDWLFEGLTYLIPKGNPTKGPDFRPITCMSNLYKLMTKCVTQVIQLEVERRGLLSDNQLVTVKRVQGAKE